MQNAIAMAMTLFLSVPALAGTISSLAPSSIQAGSGEYFIEVRGSGFGAGDEFIIDGSAGHFELTVNAIDTFGTITGWIPVEVVNRSGTYSLVVRSANGDSAPAYFTVFKPGRLPLKIHIPELITALARSPLGTGIKYEVLTSGGDGSEVQIACDPPPGSMFPFGVSKISCVASNLSGERDADSVQVHVWDGTPPVVKVPESFEIAADDERGAYVKYDTSASDDIDGELPVACNYDSGSIFPNGRTVVNCVATDKSFNYGYGLFEVFVNPRDPGKLELLVPDGVKAEATDKYGAYVTFDVTAIGSADPDPVVSCEPASGTYFLIGDSKVYCTAFDDFGQRAEAGFIVSVVEGSFLRGEDINAEATSPGGAEVEWEIEPGPKWPAAIACSPESGTLFPFGETSVECSSKDAAGEPVTGKFKVTVADTTAPHIENVRAIVGARDLDRGIVPVKVEIETVDAGDASPRCSIATLTSDAQLEWRATSDLSLELLGPMEARAFRVQVTCADASGNRATTNIPVAIDKGRVAKIQ